MSKKRTSLADALKIDENVEACSKAYAGEVPAPKEKRRPVQVYMDEAMVFRLKREALAREMAGKPGTDVASLVREAVAEWLSRLPNESVTM